MRELEGIWEDGKMVRRRLKLREATPAGPSIHHTEEQVEGKEIAGAAGGIGGGWVGGMTEPIMRVKEIERTRGRKIKKGEKYDNENTPKMREEETY